MSSCPVDGAVASTAEGRAVGQGCRVVVPAELRCHARAPAPSTSASAGSTFRSPSPWRLVAPRAPGREEGSGFPCAVGRPQSTYARKIATLSLGCPHRFQWFCPTRDSEGLASVVVSRSTPVPTEPRPQPVAARPHQLVEPIRRLRTQMPRVPLDRAQSGVTVKRLASNGGDRRRPRRCKPPSRPRSSGDS